MTQPPEVEPDADQVADPVADPDDDLAGVETSMSRLLTHGKRWLAAVVAVGLLLPFGGWAIEEFAFGSAGDRVETELGDDAPLVDAMLLVRSIDGLGRTSSGSAFLVEHDGSVVAVTNRHVVDEACSIGLRALDDGDAPQVVAHRLATDADVAVLELAGDVEVAPLELGTEAAVGDDVRVVGFPAGRAALRSGPVAEASEDRMLLDLRIDPGASGSPVLDDEGRVVGQVHARTAEGDGVATPLTQLLRAMDTADAAPACD